jgi:hypothetical protein
MTPASLKSFIRNLPSSLMVRSMSRQSINLCFGVEGPAGSVPTEHAAISAEIVALLAQCGRMTVKQWLLIENHSRLRGDIRNVSRQTGSNPHGPRPLVRAATWLPSNRYAILVITRDSTFGLLDRAF